LIGAFILSLGIQEGVDGIDPGRIVACPVGESKGQFKPFFHYFIAIGHSCHNLNCGANSTGPQNGACLCGRSEVFDNNVAFNQGENNEAKHHLWELFCD